MAFSKIILNGTVLMDVTGTGAGEKDVFKGKKFVDARGVHLIGKSLAFQGDIEQDENGYLILNPDRTETTQLFTLEQLQNLSLANADLSSDTIIYSGTYLRPYLFKNNTKIKTFIGNSVTSAAGSTFGAGNVSQTFQGCTSLIEVSLPLLTNLASAQNIFYGCTNLVTVNLSWKNITQLGNSNFYKCQKMNLINLVMPKLTSSIPANCFQQNYLLEKADLYSSNSTLSNPSIVNAGFYACSKLDTIILRYENGVIALEKTGAFTNTPFASGKAGGTLYVPQALVSSYQAATNWKTILGYTTNSIQAIEGSEYEHYYADGTEVPTE